ncbi:MAG: hypothetical protein ACI379_10005 [Nocardioides sp.]|uniref:hypothetical protein n=1 Tax=Nocardioides sp. TaxID=35761 RepID=UPI003EFE98E6
MLMFEQVLGLVLEPTDLQKVHIALNGSASSLTNSEPQKLGEGSVGGSASGREVAFHARAAHDELRSALENMAKGLEGHVEALELYRKSVNNVEDAADTYFRSLRNNSEQIASEMGDESWGDK